MSPPLSVVMPVHNAMPFLEESIRSILEQSYGDFEFVIRDDGSTDGSTDVLRDWAGRDERIRLHFGERKLGPAGSSNWVVTHSTAPLVARMDADDISHPDRLRRQMALLRSRPDTGLVGTLWEGIDTKGRKVRSLDRWRLVRKSPFVPFPHGSIMFRRDLFEQIRGYRPECNYWEDLDLFLRMAAKAPVLVIPKALYRHRFAQTSTRLSSPRAQVEMQVDRMLRCLHEYGQGRDYEALLREESPPSRKVSPDVFVSLSSTTLWSGRPPEILKPMWQRGRISLDMVTMRATIWALWSGVSPRTLRKFLRGLVRVRDMRAGMILGDASAFEWRPNQAFATPVSDDGQADFLPARRRRPIVKS